MAASKAGFGKREDRPLPLAMRLDADTAAKPKRRVWLVKRPRATADAGPRDAAASPPRPSSSLDAGRILGAVPSRAPLASAALMRPVLVEPIDETPDEGFALAPGDNDHSTDHDFADASATSEYGEPAYDPSIVAAYEPEQNDEQEPEPAPRPQRMRQSRRGQANQDREQYDHDRYSEAGDANEPASTVGSADNLEPIASDDSASEPIAKRADDASVTSPKVVKRRGKISYVLTALAVVVCGLVAMSVLRTGSTGATAGANAGATSSIFGGLTKMFEDAPLPPCPAGLIRAPDKKCWPIRKKPEAASATPSPDLPTTAPEAPTEKRAEKSAVKPAPSASR